jgi:hypothetical protein
VLYLVDGHHALAAHLITGAEAIPVKLLRPMVRPEDPALASGLVEA